MLRVRATGKEGEVEPIRSARVALVLCAPCLPLELRDTGVGGVCSGKEGGWAVTCGRKPCPPAQRGWVGCALCGRGAFPTCSEGGGPLNFKSSASKDQSEGRGGTGSSTDKRSNSFVAQRPSKEMER